MEKIKEFEKFSNNIIKLYESSRSHIWRRCLEIAEYYYKSGLWIKGIHYISDFYISYDKIEIFEQAHGCDLEFYLDDFNDDEKLLKAIENDIKEYKEEHPWWNR